MYDPTIFENLRVVFENHIYDLDTMQRSIDIRNRKDQLDLAILQRTFSIEFSLVRHPSVTVEVILTSPIEELAAEILEVEDAEPGCQLSLRILKYVENPEVQCEPIATFLKVIWEQEVEITQTISFEYGQRQADFLNTIDIDFIIKLTEENIPEISRFLETVRDMLEQIAKI